MNTKIKEEIELLEELINNPDTPADEKDLYRETIAELKAEMASSKESDKPEPKVEDKKPAPKVEKPSVSKPKAKKTANKPTVKPPVKPVAKPAAKVQKPKTVKALPEDVDKMKEEIRERTGKTEDECEKIIAEYREAREKSNKARKNRLAELKEDGKVIPGTSEKSAAAVIEEDAKAIKDKLEKQVDKLEKDAQKGDPTPEQIEARISRNLDKLSKEMTKQATGFIKGIQSELAKADKTEAKQFLLNVREEIDELLSKFAGGGAVGRYNTGIGWKRDRMFLNHEESYEKPISSKRSSYGKKKRFDVGGGVDDYTLNNIIEFKLDQTDSYFIGSIGGYNMDLIEIEYLGDNVYNALARSSSVEFDGLKGQKLQDAVYNALNEDIARNSDIKASLVDLKVLDRVKYDSGGMVQTYNITQNMGASSVNPGMFAEGGSVEDEISYNNSRINNLKDLLDISNEEEKENIRIQIAKIEDENRKLTSGEKPAKKKFLGLF